MELIHIIKDNNRTINDILSNDLKFSNRLLTKLIKNHRIFLNDSICDTRKIGNKNDVLKIDFNYSENNTNIVPKNIQLDIVYEDDWILIVNKPAGIAIHPSLSHYDNSLSNAVKYYFDSIGLNKKIRVVNRLDFNTSGLVVFAKCEYIQESFSKQMIEKSFKKEYLCIIDGLLSQNSGTLNFPIARKKDSIIERCISKNGQISITNYKVLKKFEKNNYTLVKCSLETGRTHQIRVHFSYIGHPLLGDTLYGYSSNLIDRQALHSYKISFFHPITNKYLSFYSELPNDMKKLIKE